MLSLSILVPVYNEQHLVAASLGRLHSLEAATELARIQVIVVDDCSSDRTPEVLREYEQRVRGAQASRIEWLFLRQPKNGGKGAAIRTALAHATCDITVIHDADLEYHPQRSSLRIVEGLPRRARRRGVRVALRRRRDATRVAVPARARQPFLTFLTNIVTNVNLTDMETCYKAVRTDLLKSIPLVSNDFRLEPELAIKLAKRKARIFEVPISYSGRTYQEGKKINWRDGVRALAAISRFGGPTRSISATSTARRSSADWRARRASTPGWRSRSDRTADSGCSKSAAAPAT